MSAQQLITEHIDLWTSAIKARNVQGRGSSKKRELHGVKKLRELILELAVQGKLVTQDPNDEPASALLKKIAAEKANLVKEGRIKKKKRLPEITDEEKPFDLPNGWKWARLGEVTNYGSSDKVEAKDAVSDTWILELEDVEKETSKLLQKIRFCDREFKSSKNKFYEGDVIYGKLRPYLDKVIVADDNGVCTTEMIPVRAHAAITPHHLRLIMKSPYFKEYANNSTHGMSLPRMGTDKARLAVIPIVPEQEQHRIVAKVDELMALCDQLEQQTESSLDAHNLLVDTLLATLTDALDAKELSDNWARLADHFDTLITTDYAVEQLKQTILQLAVQGKLVTQDPNDEPASELLKRIAVEKDQLIKDKKIKKQKPLPKIMNCEKPFELPVGWEWCRLDVLVQLVTSGSRGWKMYYSNSGSTFIRSQDIKKDKLEFDNKAFVDLPKATEGIRTRVEQYDLLMTITGANVAKAAWIDGVINDAFVSQHVALIRLVEVDLGRYLHVWLTGERGGRDLLLNSSYGAKPGLNLLNIRELVVPVAPCEEQRRIISKVDELMTLCDQLKAQLNDAQTTQLHLADTVVDEALN